MSENLYQPPETQSTVFPGDEFGPLNLKRAFYLGWEGFRGNMGSAVGYTLLLPLVCVLAISTCVGIFVFPHLIASASIVGLRMVRGRMEIADMFLPLKSFGATLLAFFLVMIAGQVIGILFSAPAFYLSLQNFDLKSALELPLLERLQSIWKQLNTSPPGLAGDMAGYFSHLRLIASMYLAGRMTILYPLIVERKMKAMDALATAWRSSARYHWHLLLLAILVTLISLVGLLGCLVGILFTFPLGLAIQGGAIYQILREDRIDPERTYEGPPV